MGFKANKILSLLLIIMLTLMLISCGTENGEVNTEEQQAAEEKQETEPEKDTSTNDLSDTENNTENQNPVAAKYKDLIEKSKSIDSYYCEVMMKSEMAGNTIEIPSKMWVKGNKMKVEQEMGPALTTINYWDLEQGIMYTYMEETKTATKMQVPNTNGLNQKLDSLEFDENITDKGKTTIDGKPCIAIEYKSGSTKGILYTSEENGLPLKSEVFQNDELKMEMVYRNYEIGKVTEEMVSLPEGTEITEM